MSFLDLNEVNAHENSFLQYANETQTAIIEGLKDFPKLALAKGTQKKEAEFTNGQKKSFYPLVYGHDVDELGNLRVQNFVTVLIGEDGTYCLAEPSWLSYKTPPDRVTSNAEDFTNDLIEAFEEFREVESAKQIFIAALINNPMKVKVESAPWIVRERSRTLDRIEGPKSSVAQSDAAVPNSSARKFVWLIVAAAVVLAIAFFAVRALTRKETPPPGQPNFTYDGATLPTGYPPESIFTTDPSSADPPALIFGDTLPENDNWQTTTTAPSTEQSALTRNGATLQGNNNPVIRNEPTTTQKRAESAAPPPQTAPNNTAARTEALLTKAADEGVTIPPNQAAFDYWNSQQLTGLTPPPTLPDVNNQQPAGLTPPPTWPPDRYVLPNEGGDNDGWVTPD